MIYYKPLPHIDNVRWLAKLAGPYPATRQEILEAAQDWNFSDSTIEFLRLFPADEQFKSQDDFLTRSEELHLLMREEREMPAEALHGQQD
ncbi:MAG TPA: DUF2795 domain-containing protein [Candidatus Dormibacteraeota bacterium]|nr:DUF2795 domain-containing protein [Candidatus Dormibacteraeota bacterium]